MKRYVYLAGPVLGCTHSEANVWRHRFAGRLSEHNIIGVSPLRCEPIHGNTYELGYPDDRFGTSRAIAAKNLLDVRMCDLTLAYLPEPDIGRDQSWGTISELAWARALDKPTIVVTNHEKVRLHPVINANASWMLATFEEAEDVIVGVLGAYAGGKHV